MPSLLPLSAAICVLAGWASVSTAQSSPSVPAGGAAATISTPNLAGTWDAITRSNSGIGATTILSPDSTFTMVVGAMVDFKYRIEGKKIILFSDQPGRPPDTQGLTFVGGSPVFPATGAAGS